MRIRMRPALEANCPDLTNQKEEREQSWKSFRRLMNPMERRRRKTV